MSARKHPPNDRKTRFAPDAEPKNPPGSNDHYDFLGLLHFDISATAPLPAALTKRGWNFPYGGGGIWKGTTVTLFVDNKVGEGRV